MTDPRTARIASIAEQLQALEPFEPLAVRDARRAHERAVAELAQQERLGAPARIVDAIRYRVARTADLIEHRQRQALVGV